MSSTPAAKTAKPLHSGLILMTVALGVGMVILDATVVNVALPQMIKSLGISTTEAEWVTAIYSLVLASLLLLSGRLADRFGRKAMFTTGIVVFTASSALVAASSALPLLLAARALQGLGAAFLLPASLALLNATFVGEARAKAFAIWGGVIGGAAALGPLVGGLLTTNLSWHWAFLINVPIGILLVVLALKYLPESSENKHGQGLDVVGAIFGSLAVGGLVFYFIEAPRYGWFTQVGDVTVLGHTWPSGNLSLALIAGILGLLAGVFFLWDQSRGIKEDGKTTILDLRLFRFHSFSQGSIVAFLVSLGEFGLLFTLPLFLAAVRGLSAAETGYLLTALAAGSFIASGAAVQLGKRLGPVVSLRIGLALEVAGVLATGVGISTTASVLWLVPGLMIYGMGVGLASSQVTGVILAEVPTTESGQASAVQSTTRQLGAALGTALLGAVLLAGLSNLSSDLTNKVPGIPAAQATQVTEIVKATAGAAIPSLPPQVQEVAGETFANSIKIVSYAAAFALFVGFLGTFGLKRPETVAAVKKTLDEPAAE